MISLNGYKDNLRDFYSTFKSTPSDKILNFIEYNNERQKGIIDNFNIDNVFVAEYNLPFKKLEFFNSLSSMYIKGRVGRRLDLLVMYNDIVLGILQVSSPILNSKLSLYLKDRYKDFDFNLFNKKVYEVSICIGTGIMTKFLSGKLIALISVSKEIIETYNRKYNTDIEVAFTTSIYGKSSIYNRLRSFKYLGLTEGYHSILTKKQVEEIKRKYYEHYPNRKITKTGLASHLIRLYDHLLKDNVELSFRIPKHKRGVYVIEDIYSIRDNLEYWYNRWFLPRRERIKNG